MASALLSVKRREEPGWLAANGTEALWPLCPVKALYLSMWREWQGLCAWG